MSRSNTNANGGLTSTSVQDLMNLIKSLYKIIEGLNARLERFEGVSKDDDKDVSRGVDKDVSNVVVKKISNSSEKSVKNVDINVTVV